MSELFALGFLSIGAWKDAATGKIPNPLILSGWIAGFLFLIYSYGREGCRIFLGRMFLPIILFYLLFLIRALGAGDIKLFSVVNCFLTVEDFYEWVLFTGVCACFFCVGKIVKERGFRRGMTICFALPMWLGMLLKLGVDHWIRSF